jgi:hypothetical protein
MRTNIGTARASHAVDNVPFLWPSVSVWEALHDIVTGPSKLVVDVQLPDLPLVGAASCGGNSTLWGTTHIPTSTTTTLISVRRTILWVVLRVLLMSPSSLSRVLTAALLAVIEMDRSQNLGHAYGEVVIDRTSSHWWHVLSCILDNVGLGNLQE